VKYISLSIDVDGQDRDAAGEELMVESLMMTVVE
jgi:hypothetical protein